MGQPLSIKDENKIVSDWLLRYPERVEQYKEMLSGFQILGATQYDGMPHSSSVGNPTASKGMKLSDIERQKDWIMVVEMTEQVLSEKKKMFLMFRRQVVNHMYINGGRPSWTGNVQCKYAEWHNRKYGGNFAPSIQVMKDWWNEIIDVAVRIAIRKGCL
jgi:hypothetical protein